MTYSADAASRTLVLAPVTDGRIGPQQRFPDGSLEDLAVGPDGSATALWYRIEGNVVHGHAASSPGAGAPFGPEEQLGPERWDARFPAAVATGPGGAALATTTLAGVLQVMARPAP
jgi:hypothetical protein